MNKSIESYQKRAEILYGYKLKQTLNAALAYADACDRCGAVYDRLSLVRYCVNSMPEITGLDALAIADCIRGRNIKCN